MESLLALYHLSFLSSNSNGAYEVACGVNGVANIESVVSLMLYYERSGRFLIYRMQRNGFI